EPQYWQLNLSRRNTLKRVNAGWVAGFTKVLSDTTLGSFISRLGLRTARSYWATMFTRSRKTALMASCRDHSDTGYELGGRKSALRTRAGKPAGDRFTALLPLLSLRTAAVATVYRGA